MINNKYTRIYNQIIDRAKSRLLTGYCETHHIIPRSLGGTNSKDNLVSLTAREHFVCHLLLTKMYTGTNKAKMIHAAWAMANLINQHQSERYKVTGKIYETLRMQYAAQTKNRLKGSTRSPHTEETKKKIGLASRGRRKGISMSAESKKKLSESMKGKNKGKIRTQEFKDNLSLQRKGKPGKPHTEETKEKIRLANLGKIRGPQEKVRCPHCGKTGGKAPMSRFHFNNCKYKDPSLHEA